MEISKTNKGLIAITALSVVAYLAFQNIFKKTESEKSLGNTCNNFGSAPDGIIVYDYPLTGMKSQNNPAPSLKCKRCNPTGCRQEQL